MEELKTKTAFSGIWGVSWRLMGMFSFKKYKWLYYIYSVFINITVSTFTPITFFAYIFVAPTWKDLLGNLQFNMTFISCTFKQWGVWWWKDNLIETEKYFDELDERVKRNYEETDHVLKVVKFWRKMFVIFTSMYITCIPLIALASFLTGEKRLIFIAWFPFDYKEKYFWHAYIFQVYATSIACFQNSANDFYPMLYMAILKSHVHTLNLRIKRIGEKGSLTLTENYNELLACIRDHKKIINILNLIRPAISLTSAMQIIVQSFIICITAVVLIFFATSKTEVGSSCYYLFIVFTEIMPECFLGTLLTLKFNELTTSIFKCNWIEQNRNFKKTLLIFMQNTQKIKVLSAGELFIIDVSTAIAIIKFSFSLFTLLSKMH